MSGDSVTSQNYSCIATDTSRVAGLNGYWWEWKHRGQYSFKSERREGFDGLEWNWESRMRVTDQMESLLFSSLPFLYLLPLNFSHLSTERSAVIVVTSAHLPSKQSRKRGNGRKVERAEGKMFRVITVCFHPSHSLPSSHLSHFSLFFLLSITTQVS